MGWPLIIRIRRDVRLAVISPEHAGAMYRWACDPDVASNIGLRSDPTLGSTSRWIEAARQDPTMRPFAIMLGESHVGNIVLDRIDGYLSTARLSIYIGEPAARDAGIGTTAIYRALSEGFQALNLYKVWLTVHEWNFRAMRTYTSLGFALEGILRGEFLLDGSRVSAFYMGLLRDDFVRLEVRPAPEGQSQ